MESLDNLENFLRTAPILDVCAFPVTGGAHPGKLVIFEGGVGALAKAADENAAATSMVPREVAAWVVARALGWSDLLAATVLRQIPSKNVDVEAAVIVAWPAPQPDVALPFDDDDRWRAAAFDLAVNQADRNGHNWLAVPNPAHGPPRLKLVDHGHCFGYPNVNGAVNSTFFNEKQGQQLPPRITEALNVLLDELPREALEDLLGDSETTKLEVRVRAALAAGVLGP